MSIEDKFSAAVNVIKSLPSDGAFQPSEDLMLKLNTYYKQATEGPCNIPKPSVWYYSARNEWTTWNDLGNMSKEDAMEKYVEELSKVIETMSYNETVSRFVSLLGPFYEVVTADEMEQQSVKKLKTASRVEFAYPMKNLEDLHISKNEPSRVDSSEQTDFPFSDKLNAGSPETPKSPSIRNAIPHKWDAVAGSQSSVYHPRQKATDVFRPKTSCVKKQHFVSQQDMLILTIINLQSSLEGIVKKLDKLQALAKTTDLNYKVETDASRSQDWNLNVSGTLFALIWPIAIHLCTRIS